ncbi:MAG: DnaA/Hda family protein [Planctomycetota bacterium]
MHTTQTIEIPGGWDCPAGVVGASRFVVGPENQLLLSPLAPLLNPRSTEESAPDAERFNPLVLIGPSGGGKSTLLRGVVACWRSFFGNEAIGSFSIVDFGREAQSAHSQGETSAWRRRFRELRLLALDDLQRLRPRSSIRAELRIAMDAVLASGGTVLVASQVEPAALTALDSGLRDRLAAGLLVRLKWPGRAARQALLAHEAEHRRIDCSREQIDRLAEQLEGPPSRILGALLKPGCFDRPSSASRDENPTMKQIVTVASRYFRVNKAMLTGKSRRKSLVFARSIVVHLARRLTALSYAQIGVALGGRDHTTVMHADRSISQKAASDAQTQRALEQLERILRAP